MKFERRKFFTITALTLTALISRFSKRNFLFGSSSLPENYLRPPGAGDESDFLTKCVRCRACADVCEAGCIRFISLTESAALAGTPYLEPRIKSCNLCTNCTQVCPTGALTPIKRDLEDISEKVAMGTAVVIKSNCLSFNGRICGICRDACPLGGKAIKLVSRAMPEVIADACIGCGRCEERCPQSPAAIIVRKEVKQYEA